VEAWRGCDPKQRRPCARPHIHPCSSLLGAAPNGGVCARLAPGASLSCARAPSCDNMTFFPVFDAPIDDTAVAGTNDSGTPWFGTSGGSMGGTADSGPRAPRSRHRSTGHNALAHPRSRWGGRRRRSRRRSRRSTSASRRPPPRTHRTAPGARPPRIRHHPPHPRRR
jgi:hypothetical protein